MSEITYTLTVETASNEGQANAEAEAEAVKTVLESAISDLKISSGMAQIQVTSLEEN